MIVNETAIHHRPKQQDKLNIYRSPQSLQQWAMANTIWQAVKGPRRIKCEAIHKRQ